MDFDVKRENAFIVIFTDLDGTLLDFHTYSYKGADEALAIIREKGIPLVIVTSKTRAEVEVLREKLAIHDPFIVENGGGIFFEKGYRGFEIPGCISQNGYCLIELGKDYREVRRFFRKLKERFPVVGFGDMSVEEIAKLTGLGLEEAKRASRREFSEPFILKNSSLISGVKREAERHGFCVLKGGRFFHLIASSQSKGKAVKVVSDVFRRNLKRRVVTVALGDSQNDEDMLKAVDIPILIPYPDGSFSEVKVKNLRRAEFPGSRGWNEAVKGVLHEFEEDC